MGNQEKREFLDVDHSISPLSVFSVYVNTIVQLATDMKK